jgi:two-component system cell cycle response regulator
MQATAPESREKPIQDGRGNTQICVAPVSDDDIERRQPTPILYLIIVRGGIPGTMFRLVRGTGSVGRGADNTVSLHEATVSRRHAVISIDPSGIASLTDVGSTNGTFVDGNRLAPNRPVQVSDGSRIQLGASVLLKYVRLDPCEEGYQREMYERTVRDELTGLYNRSYFVKGVAPLTDRSSIREMGLAILLIDLDHFKRINDGHGHEIGDEVLREVGRILRESARAEDLIARSGGEEFVIALPCHSLEQAIERAERIRGKIAGGRIDGRGRDLRVTASFGVAYSPPGCMRNLAVMISAADEALYLAKKRGRNRVICSSRTGPDMDSRTESTDGFPVY